MVRGVDFSSTAVSRRSGSIPSGLRHTRRHERRSPVHTGRPRRVRAVLRRLRRRRDARRGEGDHQAAPAVGRQEVGQVRLQSRSASSRAAAARTSHAQGRPGIPQVPREAQRVAQGARRCHEPRRAPARPATTSTCTPRRRGATMLRARRSVSLRRGGTGRLRGIKKTAVDKDWAAA